jgi:hypothetical protein
LLETDTIDPRDAKALEEGYLAVRGLPDIPECKFLRLKQLHLECTVKGRARRESMDALAGCVETKEIIAANFAGAGVQSSHAMLERALGVLAPAQQYSGQYSRNENS